MPEIHLRQPGFTYSACGPFTRNGKRTEKFKETGDSKYICQNKLDKACFQHVIGLWSFKYLNRRTAANKVFHDKAFSIAKNPKYGGYQRGFASVVYKLFDKKASGGTVKNEIISYKELSKEKHKQIVRKIVKEK